MKKILLALSLLLAFAELRSQVGTPNVPAEPFDYLYYRFRNYVEVSGGLIFPNRDTNWTPRGPAITYYNDAWYGYSPTVGYWKALLETPAAPNAILSGENIIQIGDTTFFISAGRYRIDGVTYAGDSATLTVRLSDSLNRIDKFYLAIDGLPHVKEGVPSLVAQEPQLDGDQLALAFVSILEDATSVNISSTIVYDENTGESNVTNVGTTTDPNNTTNTFTGVKSLNVTNINDPAGTGVDEVNLTRPTGTWSLSAVDGFQFAIKLKAVMNGNANLRAQFFVGNTAASAEVLVVLNKNNTTSFQPIAIPFSLFSPISNYSITRVRFRYTRPGSAANYTGFYLDDIKFVDGLTPPSVGSVSSVGINIIGNAYLESNTPVTGTGVLTLTPQGNTTHYIDGAGNLRTFPTIVDTISTLNGRAKNHNGGTVDGRAIYLHEADSVYEGLFTPAMYETLYEHDSLQNTGPSGIDTLLWPIDAHTIGVKGIKDSLGFHIIDHGTYWTAYVDTTGGGGSSRFGVSGEDDAAGESRFFNAGNNNYGVQIGSGVEINFRQQLPSDPDDFLRFSMGDGDQNIVIEGGFELQKAGININSAGHIVNIYSEVNDIRLTGIIEPFAGTHKMLVWDSTTNRLFATAVPSGGGSTPGIDDVLAEAQNQTADRAINTNGNQLSAGDGAVYSLLLYPAFGVSALRSFDPTAGDNTAGLYNTAEPTTSNFQLVSKFNGTTKVADITGLTTSSISSINETADSIRLIQSNFVSISDSAKYYMALINKTTKAIGYYYWPGGSAYTDEQAQDAAGAMIDASLNYVDGTPLLQRAALTGAITASAGSNATSLGSFTTAQLNTALSDNDVATGGGTATGTNTGDQTTITGNAGTATTFQNSRNIQGVAFNGSANIDIINGNGFVKVTGTTLSYDNSTYLTTSSAASTYQPLDGDLTTIAGLTATTDNFLVSVSSAWASRTPAQVKTTLALVTGTDVQAYDADLTTYAGITPSANVQTLLGAADYSAFKTSLSLNNVNNTSDANKPVSTATQTALDTKITFQQVLATSFMKF